MRSLGALIGGLLSAATIANTLEGCSAASCTKTVYDLAPGTYRTAPGTEVTNETDYQLVYSTDTGTVIETYTRAGQVFRNEYSAAAQRTTTF